jgi:hypothetical protein
MYAGSAGLLFARDSAATASAPPQSINYAEPYETPPLRNLGLHRLPGTTSLEMFYISLGFEVLGPARDCAPARTMGDSDIVLRRILAEV